MNSDILRDVFFKALGPVVVITFAAGAALLPLYVLYDKEVTFRQRPPLPARLYR
tara:strand:+ start:600 stop:761 length:162 start_codon:yes stop_codon:yes gene_type:complete